MYCLQGSNDSGKGGSDVTAPVLEENGVVCKTNSRTSRRTSSCSSACSDAAIATTVVQQPTLPCVYEFVIPQQLVGRLIGKHGCFVQQIKTETNSSIFVKRHPESPKFKVCAIEGKYIILIKF
jgi:A-kinase anchor protein 1